MRGLAAIKMSLRQYFRLLLGYRDIWLYPNERTTACALMATNYFVVVLPSQQSKRVVRLTACNYERCVSVTIFSGCKIRITIDYKQYHLIKLIKKERLERFTRLNDQNMHRDSLYRYISVSSWVGAPFKLQETLLCRQLPITAAA